MTLVDWAVVIILVCSVLAGLAQGFFRSACSLGGLILGLVIAAWNYGRVATHLIPLVHVMAIADTIAFLLIALLVMVTRRHAVSQAAGFLMLDNGIAATAFLLTAGVPLIVELGASLDVLFAVIVIGVLTGRMSRTFGGADLDALQELHD